MLDNLEWLYRDTLPDDALVPDECVCCYPEPCGASPTTPDCIGYLWCEDHDYRGEFLAQGKVHGWPVIQTDGFLQADEQFYWTITALYESDERILDIVSALNEQQQKRSA